MEFQETALKLLKEQRPGEVQPHEIAYLEDRILVNKEGYQVYGTQLAQNGEGKLVPIPIKDPDTVDQRRRNVGLEPLEEYLKKTREFYSSG
ncbi:MAG: hypothetical protein D6719_07740 [Candidatus Dadabacteria bacterium]|nr:MAG: hypothetical protein D6719_07740 [Candidatus Dadabacteria bacterium]